MSGMINDQIKSLVRGVCEARGVPLHLLPMDGRLQSVVAARRCITYILRAYPLRFGNPSYPTICEAIKGHSGHASAIYWFRDAAKDPAIVAWCEEFMKTWTYSTAPAADIPDDLAEERAAELWRERLRGVPLGSGVYRNFCYECNAPLMVLAVAKDDRHLVCNRCRAVEAGVENRKVLARSEA